MPPGPPHGSSATSTSSARSNRSPAGAVYVVGGAGLVRSLIDEALIDELRLIVHPVAVGAGTGAGLFDGIAQRQDLELIDSERTPAGRVHLTYHVPAPRTGHAH